MDSGMELHQAIYQYYLSQIRFGFYGFGEKLPALEDTCRQFHTSLDSVRPAYHRLRQEGYITLSQKAGAKVTVKYEPKEIEQHIHAFYAARKESLTDLSCCIWPLLGQAQCFAFKYAALKPKDVPCSSGSRQQQTAPAVWEILDSKYEVLGNELLMRLTRYLYLYFFGSFCGVFVNVQLHEKAFRQIEAAEGLCIEGRWDELPDVLKVIQEEISNTLSRFYDQCIPLAPAGSTLDKSEGPEYVFRWDAYKKSSQLRYSLAMELLTEICQGTYPVGGYLPSAERISIQKGVSVSTVRRAVCLLNSIGAVKSSRPLGARVLLPFQAVENCDFTHPDLRRRLLDLAESLQIFALSAKAVCALTLAALDGPALSQWMHYLHDLRTRGHCERVIYVSLSLICAYTPYGTLRAVYSELLHLLFWGYPLEGMIRTKDEADIFFAPYFERMLRSLEQQDISCFSTTLEFLLNHELSIIVDVLMQLGIREAGNILIAEAGESIGSFTDSL